jgi:TIR domain
MAQSPGYDHDIFISYAHNDNYEFGGRPGWVDVFEDWLYNWLHKRRGLTDLRIWRDKKRMHGNTVFDDAIQNALDSSAMFLALTSRNYLQSDYCRKELRRFHQHHSRQSGGLRVGDSFRLYNILLNNIPHQKWPAEFQGTSGFAMNDAESDDTIGDFTSPNDSAFEKQMRPIVDAVEDFIQKMAPAPVAETGNISQIDQVSIFLADVPDALQDFRERIMAEIQQQEVVIAGDIPPPMDVAGHADAVSQSLSRAQFSIHLLNQWPGRKIVDRKETTYPLEQHEIAFKQSIQQLVWVPPDLDIAAVENEAQRRFLQNCETRPRTMGQYELVKCLQSDFVSLVRERIDQCRQQTDDQARNLSYLIDTHQKDQRYAFKLADLLLEKGAEVDFNHESRDPTVSLAKFEQSVKNVKNLVLVCGKVGPAWLIGRIKKAFKAISEQFEFENQSNLEHIWLYLAPHSAGKPDLPAFPPLIHIDILDNSQSDHIDPLITARLLAAGVER